ncbi:AraC family transcriptional regulator [Bacillus gobiensis]|uniref:AraC family transcriptional regulator n=1 Tax=Bacillus gobiensis TaxID=1441095 RepID=UPI003D1CDDAC
MLMEAICEKRTYSREYDSHEHSYGQFLFPLKGNMDLLTKEQKIELDRDHGLYLPPGCSHTFRSSTRNECLVLDIPERFLTKNTSSMFIPIDQQWSSIRFLLLEEAALQRSSSSALTELTGYVSRKLTKSPSSSIEYIHRHFLESISVEELANIEYYHPAYYSAWFKQKTGKNLKVYLSELRVKEAKRLLHETDWTITRISEEFQFEHSSSFTRWFRCYAGVTPKQYRQIKT